MDRFVAKLNIEHFRKLLAAETDEKKRQTLSDLLAREEEKLATALARAAEEDSERSKKKI